MDPTPILLETTVLVDTFLINSFGFETPRVHMDMFWNHTFGSEIGEGFKEDSLQNRRDFFERVLIS